MTTANPLYHDIILEHYEYPRNKGLLADADATSRGDNPTCGDDLFVSVKVGCEKCPEVGWDGHACAIGEASASMMADAVQGKGTAEARRWIGTIRGMLTRGTGDKVSGTELGDLEALEGIRNYPVRIKCALLAWEALDEALTLAEGKNKGNG
jgi:nitrogen fixation protein NifU and related proteins